MLSSFTIKNYKSIVDLTLDLGRFNLFIGENGSGKTSILEALGMVAGVPSGRLTNEDLISRGVRVARPSLTTNAFINCQTSNVVDISWTFSKVNADKQVSGVYRLSWQENQWKTLRTDKEKEWWQQKVLNHPRMVEFTQRESQNINSTEEFEEKLANVMGEILPGYQLEERRKFLDKFQYYGIYCANSLALRGLQTESHREPLGLYGEGLDVAINQLSVKQKSRLLEYAKMVSWLEDIDIDQTGQRKLEGYKPSRSRSNLYFTDKFLSKDNQIFSAENANEGILHILFHLALFLHPEAPKIFAIDNIETALNPHLLRFLVKALAKLAKEEERQALVTTHNPAALDGLNLHDDDQRLFVVYRNEEGHTLARRIKVKPESSETEPKFKLKLSELWMRGLLGGIPTHF